MEDSLIKNICNQNSLALVKFLNLSHYQYSEKIITEMLYQIIPSIIQQFPGSTENREILYQYIASEVGQIFVTNKNYISQIVNFKQITIPMEYLSITNLISNLNKNINAISFAVSILKKINIDVDNNQFIYVISRIIQNQSVKGFELQPLVFWNSAIYGNNDMVGIFSYQGLCIFNTLDINISSSFIVSFFTSRTIDTLLQHHLLGIFIQICIISNNSALLGLFHAVNMILDQDEPNLLQVNNQLLNNASNVDIKENSKFVNDQNKLNIEFSTDQNEKLNIINQLNNIDHRKFNKTDSEDHEGEDPNIIINEQDKIDKELLIKEQDEKKEGKDLLTNIENNANNEKSNNNFMNWLNNSAKPLNIDKDEITKLEKEFWKHEQYKEEHIKTPNKGNSSKIKLKNSLKDIHFAITRSIKDYNNIYKSFNLKFGGLQNIVINEEDTKIENTLNSINNYFDQEKEYFKDLDNLVIKLESLEKDALIIEMISKSIKNYNKLVALRNQIFLISLEKLKQREEHTKNSIGANIIDSIFSFDNDYLILLNSFIN